MSSSHIAPRRVKLEAILYPHLSICLSSYKAPDEIISKINIVIIFLDLHTSILKFSTVHTIIPLDSYLGMVILGTMSKGYYSTAEVARLAGVHKNTLLRWLYAGEVPEPKQTIGKDTRVWSDEELENVKRYKEKNYQKRS